MSVIPLLQPALAKRDPNLPSNAVRLFHRSADREPGLAVDRYADWIVLHTYNESIQAEAARIAQWYLQRLKIRGVYLKDRVRNSKGAYPPQNTEPILGVPAPSKLQVFEHDCKFYVDCAHQGINTGLFMDQRENRAYLTRTFGSKKGELLNGFCYTGAFSIALAACGWNTTSVDTSRPALNWCREHFQLNGLGNQHKLIREEFSLYLRRLSRRQASFDGIVIDPPTMARSPKGKISFRLKKDAPRLLKECLRLVRPDGFLLWTCNDESLTQTDFEALLQTADSAFQRMDELPGQPTDYPLANQQGHLKGVLYRRRA